MNSSHLNYAQQNGTVLRPSKRVSWAAVFGGIVVGLALQALLSLAGLAIGAGSFDPAAEANPGQGIGMFSGLWFVGTLLVSSFVGGLIAARLSGFVTRGDGIMHGLLTWGLSTLLTLWLVSSAAGSILGGALRLAGVGATAVTTAVGAAAPQIGQAISGQLAEEGFSISTLRNELETLLRQTRAPELQPENLQEGLEGAVTNAEGTAQDAARVPQATDEELRGLVDRVFAQGTDVVSAVDRDAIVNVLVARTNLDRPAAEATVDRWGQALRDTRARAAEAREEAARRARETADLVARRTSQGALWSFVGLVLAGLAASGGGAAGVRKVRLAQDNRLPLDPNLTTRNEDDSNYYPPTGRAS